MSNKLYCLAIVARPGNIHGVAANEETPYSPTSNVIRTSDSMLVSGIEFPEPKTSLAMEIFE